MLRRWGHGRHLARARVIGAAAVLVACSIVATGCDSMTGGGWIPSLAPGQKARFGFTARCKNTKVDGMPVAVFYDGQFDFDDRAFNPLARVHGTVEPFEFASVAGQTCQQVASEFDVAGVHPALSQFGGTYRTKPAVGPSEQGDFAVTVTDEGEGQALGLLRDNLCVDLAGALTYFNCGPVEGGDVQVQ
jgi:hypothetical protein